MQELAHLNATFGRAGQVEFQPSPLGGTVALLTCDAGRATVALHGAHVLSWQPAGHDEVLWLSPEAKIEAGTAIRGGIPVCWPWFAQHPQDPSKPMHGFVRIRTWDVIESGASPGAARLVLRTRTTPDDAALWPHSAEVALEIEVGQALRLTLSTRNTGTDDLPLTQALHNYFRVGDIAQVHIDGLGGCDFIDKVDGNSRKRQTSPTLHIDREVDRIYLGDTGRIALIDTALGRRIGVHSNSRSAVVWNPWVDRAAQMAGIGADGYRTMQCIETTNAGDDIVQLAPGSTHALRAELSAAAD